MLVVSEAADASLQPTALREVRLRALRRRTLVLDELVQEAGLSRVGIANDEELEEKVCVGVERGDR